MRQMMSLGGFVFSLSEGTPYTGQQLENITVTGTWFQGDGMANLNALRALQNQRAPLVLADGYGNNLGQWTIKRLQEKQDKIIDDGTAFVLAFTLELEEYANDNHP
jgi:phage protein U